MTPPPAPQNISPITESDAWQALSRHRQALNGQSIAGLFAEDPRRFDNFSLQAANLMLDYSKHLLTTETRSLLTGLAVRAGLPAAIEAMFTGTDINSTEHRPALHVALRSPHRQTMQEQQVHDCLQRMTELTTKVHSGAWRGYDGSAITDVVNIGIGGSDLGPSMVYEALRHHQRKTLRCHFVSNADPCHLEQTLETLRPGSTLFIIASKSFTTLETSLNAEAARQWLLHHGADSSALAKHFVAVTANIPRAEDFGMARENIFPIWDWVGGRYSLWSAIGLAVALGTGMDSFMALLQGAHEMDEHFRLSPLAENIPVMMALLAIWYLNFWAAQSQVVLPYAQNLHLFPAYLQQLDMESLGKRVRRDGTELDTPSGGIIWGSAGTNGQHSFHQLLHQGSHLIPADFIAIAASSSNLQTSHQQLLANCLAQSQALMLGKPLSAARSELQAAGLPAERIDELAPHMVVPGNRPSSSILLKRLDPRSLGSLIAAYEHKVYAQSVILQLNPFDQWGVELGKALSKNMLQALNGSPASRLDDSSSGLIKWCRQHTGNPDLPS